MLGNDCCEYISPELQQSTQQQEHMHHSYAPSTKEPNQFGNNNNCFIQNTGKATSSPSASSVQISEAESMFTWRDASSIDQRYTGARDCDPSKCHIS